jgi:hypothetical protein
MRERAALSWPKASCNEMNIDTDHLKPDLVVVTVVKHIDKISVEWVDVIEDGEFVQNDCELVVIALRCELHFADVETPDALDRVTLMHNCGGVLEEQAKRSTHLSEFCAVSWRG